MTVLHEGDRIHCKTIKGQLTIIKLFSNGVAVTAKVWIARANYPKLIPWKFVKYKDIHALADGGKFRYKAEKTYEVHGELPEFKGEL